VQCMVQWMNNTISVYDNAQDESFVQNMIPLALPCLLIPFKRLLMAIRPGAPLLMDVLFEAQVPR
jgi:hypothetical protein